MGQKREPGARMGVGTEMNCTPHTRLPSQRPRNALKQGWQHEFVSSVLHEVQQANRRSQLQVQLLYRQVLLHKACNVMRISRRNHPM